LEELERISIGNFFIKDSIDIEEITYDKLFDYNKALDFMPIQKVDGDLLKQVSNGMTIRLNREEENLLMKTFDDKNLAVYTKFKTGLYKCLRGL
jgi:hypothetical protein